VALSWHVNTAPPDADARADMARTAATEQAAGGGGLQAPPGSTADAPPMKVACRSHPSTAAA
jgi:hypothetical protein